jgi:hypothetical protein
LLKDNVINSELFIADSGNDTELQEWRDAAIKKRLEKIADATTERQNIGDETSRLGEGTINVTGS